MKRINVLVGLSVVAMFFIAFNATNNVGILSTGAPPAHTGAPGEPTCAKSGCHAGSVVNSGAGYLTISYNNNLNEYVPGVTYEVIITMDEAGIDRFGFEFTAISDITGDEAGSLLITDSLRMQTMQGPAPLEGRRYITYKYAGTEPFAPGRGEWTFDWTAPDSDIGPVSFYVTAASANNDATDSGDLIYSTYLNILPDITSGVRHRNLINFLTVYPNPATEMININTGAKFAQKVRVSIYTISGQKVDDFNFDGCCSELDVADYESGTYLVKVAMDDQILSHRFLIIKE